MRRDALSEFVKTARIRCHAAALAPLRRGRPAHLRPETSRPWRRLLAGVAVLLVVSGGAITTLDARGAFNVGALAAASSGTTSTTLPTTVPSTTLPPARLKVLAVRPKPGAMAVGFSSDISVQFSVPLAADTADPRLSPNVPGKWTLEGSRTLVFRPSGFFIPLSKLVLTVPAGRLGPKGILGQSLASRYSESFTVAGVSVLRLQQLLAELNYLPVRFDLPPVASDHPSDSLVGTDLPGVPRSLGSSTVARRRRRPRSAIDGEATYPADVARVPQPGSWLWRYRHTPAALASLWRPGVDTVLVQGAVMAFESDHGLADNAVLTAAFWADMFRAVAHRRLTKGPYDYLEVSMALPETLSVWRNGRVIFRTPVNTGIPEAPTQPGTFPVYARYLSTTMSGYNPDGSYYSDPGIPDVAYFNGGDAVHGFLRASYGFPQSLGCVELPFAAAAVVFTEDPIGTLVNIE